MLVLAVVAHPCAELVPGPGRHPKEASNEGRVGANAKLAAQPQWEVRPGIGDSLGHLDCPSPVEILDGDADTFSRRIFEMDRSYVEAIVDSHRLPGTGLKKDTSASRRPGDTQRIRRGSVR